MKLIIANTGIHQDAEGRFSLNDLHKAAGGEDRHRPNYFLENQQTKALVAEIEKAGIPAIAAKQRVGTFAAKELVYAYAMWISPTFHLQVIRAYDEMVMEKISTGGTARHLSRNQVAASILLLRSAAEDLKLAPSAVLGGYQRLEAQLGVTGLLPAYTVDAPTSSGTGSGEPTLPLGAMLERYSVGMSAISFNRLLVQAGFLEEIERPSSKGGTKKYKSITDLEYGKNMNSAENPRETQPHWYISKFPELLELVMPAKLEVVS